MMEPASNQQNDMAMMEGMVLMLLDFMVVETILPSIAKDLLGCTKRRM